MNWRLRWGGRLVFESINQLGRWNEVLDISPLNLDNSLDWWDGRLVLIEFLMIFLRYPWAMLVIFIFMSCPNSRHWKRWLAVIYRNNIVYIFYD